MYHVENIYFTAVDPRMNREIINEIVRLRAPEFLDRDLVEID